uniref:Uncharacterized protein n=1 Tax=Populus alba TaxID=43335 RepID=A0A4U5N8J3_POPAL|nr:hypothetical protein D5086_0000273560 [Populus alba]
MGYRHDSNNDFYRNINSKEKAKEAIFYSYTRYFNGFAAILEDEEAAEISKHPKVLSVFRNQISKLHTTNSWDFLGLERDGEIPADSMWPKAKFGEGVIIGTLDFGVWPESESFNDEGMGPVPSNGKGTVTQTMGLNATVRFVTSNHVVVTRKLIGARYFSKGYEAERYNGHGTHTLSTAGGRFVSGANLLGSAYGTAKGGSPNSRVASYKVFWPDCLDAGVLAGYEAAIHDGVDILSVSLGFVPNEYFKDRTAIGAFDTVENGILVVAAAGNEGPAPGAVVNVASMDSYSCCPFLGEPYICQSHNNTSLVDFNYPSITVPNLSGKITLSRTLKNVGTPSSSRVHIKAPRGISVKVEPRSLRFDKKHEEKMFEVTVEAKKGFN